MTPSPAVAEGRSNAWREPHRERIQRQHGDCAVYAMIPGVPVEFEVAGDLYVDKGAGATASTFRSEDLPCRVVLARKAS